VKDGGFSELSRVRAGNGVSWGIGSMSGKNWGLRSFKQRNTTVVVGLHFVNCKLLSGQGIIAVGKLARDVQLNVYV